VAFGLCSVGVLISTYLTYEHFTDSTTLACSDSGTVNCLKVATSLWSVIAGVPVAVAGLAFFLAMTLLCAPTRWHATRLCFGSLGAGRRHGDGAVARLCGDLQGRRNLPVVHGRPRRHPAAASHLPVVAGERTLLSVVATTMAPSRAEPSVAIVESASGSYGRNEARWRGPGISRQGQSPAAVFLEASSSGPSGPRVE